MTQYSVQQSFHINLTKEQMHQEYLNYRGDDYVCCYCGKHFYNFSTFEVHMKKENQFKPYICKVEGCQKRFSMLGQMNRHLKMVHANDNRIVCKTCGKEFKYESSLKVHTRIHEKVSKYTCPVPDCGKGFTNLAHFNYHKAHQHRPLQEEPVQQIDTNIREENKSEDESDYGDEDQQVDKKLKIIPCQHSGCDKKFHSYVNWCIHHERYSKYCTVEMAFLRKKTKEIKDKLKISRKKVDQMKQLLKNKGIAFQDRLQELMHNKQLEGEDEQGDYKDLEPEKDDLTTTALITTGNRLQQVRKQRNKQGSGRQQRRRRKPQNQPEVNIQNWGSLMQINTALNHIENQMSCDTRAQQSYLMVPEFDALDDFFKSPSISTHKSKERRNSHT